MATEIRQVHVERAADRLTESWGLLKEELEETLAEASLSLGEYGFDWWLDAEFKLLAVNMEQKPDNLIIDVRGVMVLNLEWQPKLREMAERVASLVPQDEVVG